jgi:hypothetical protein
VSYTVLGLSLEFVNTAQTAKENPIRGRDIRICVISSARFRWSIVEPKKYSWSRQYDLPSQRFRDTMGEKCPAYQLKPQNHINLLSVSGFERVPGVVPGRHPLVSPETHPVGILMVMLTTHASQHSGPMPLRQWMVATTHPKINRQYRIK